MVDNLILIILTIIGRENFAWALVGGTTVDNILLLCILFLITKELALKIMSVSYLFSLTLLFLMS